MQVKCRVYAFIPAAYVIDFYRDDIFTLHLQNNEALLRHAAERDAVLPEIANWVHDSVPVSKVRRRRFRSPSSIKVYTLFWFFHCLPDSATFMTG